jgi:large subunit ribosomal protein L37Ae
MGRTKKVDRTGRFGARGGAANRKRLLAVERVSKLRYECPKCFSRAVRKQSIGIWHCYRCGYTYAGGAFTPTTKLGLSAKRVKGVASGVKTSEEKKVKKEVQ